MLIVHVNLHLMMFDALCNMLLHLHGRQATDSNHQGRHGLLPLAQMLTELSGVYTYVCTYMFICA